MIITKPCHNRFSSGIQPMLARFITNTTYGVLGAVLVNRYLRILPYVARTIPQIFNLFPSYNYFHASYLLHLNAVEVSYGKHCTHDIFTVFSYKIHSFFLLIKSFDIESAFKSMTAG